MIKEKLKIELIEKLHSLKEQFSGQKIESGSLEGYLLNHIDKFIDSLADAKSSSDISNACSTFSRFCTESMDWDMALYKECTMIVDKGLKLSKLFDEKTT